MKKMKATRTLLNSATGLDVDGNDLDDRSGNHPTDVSDVSSSLVSTAAVGSDAAPTIKKEVRFLNSVSVLPYEVYSDDAKRDMFMTRQDISEIHMQYRESMQCMSFPTKFSADEQEELLECARALQTVQSCKDRAERRRVAQRTVLAEQARQDRLAVSDEDRLSEVYQSISEESRRRAYMLGLQDEEDAKLISINDGK